MYYDCGWNDYVNGIKPDFHMDAQGEGGYNDQYKDGWYDCQEATLKYGQQEEI